MNTANMVATMGSVVLLGIAGRKTLMLINQMGCIACLAVMWYATLKGNSNLELIFVIVFVCAFEFGPGPIVWIYISEICNDKAASVATTTNWVFTLIISIISPYMLKNWFHAYTWLIIAIASAIVSSLFLVN